MNTLLRALAAVLLIGSAGAHALNVGAIGDSLTDEYLPSSTILATDLAAKSWVQILAETRSSNLNFGSYHSPSDLRWQDNREYGYEYNWAKVGGIASDNAVLKVAHNNLDPVTLGDATASMQVAGLAPQISAGKIDSAVVAIGSNDFFFHAYQFDLQQNATPDPMAEIDQAFLDDVTGSILSTVDTLRAAGNANIVLGLIPMATAASGPELQSVLDGIAQANQTLIAGARTRGIPYVDLFGWASDPGRVDSSGNVTIGNLVVVMNTTATTADLVPTGTPGAGPCNSLGMCAGPTDATKFIAEDGVHPNTAIQALMANQILQAINTANSTSIPLLNDNEIVALTGEVSPVPLPSAFMLFGSSMGLLSIATRRRAQR